MARPPPPNAAAGGGAPSLLSALGDRAWQNSDKVSAEFVAIMYGTLVKSLLDDAALTAAEGPLSDAAIDAVNASLFDMGISIGMRMIDEFLAKSGAPPCRTLAMTAEAVAKVAVRMFLGVAAGVERLVVGSQDGPRGGVAAAVLGTSVAPNTTAQWTSYSIVFDENPLNGFAELPEALRARLWYSNLLAGILSGALGQVGFKRVTVEFTRCKLRGDTTHEITVRQLPSTAATS